MRHSIAARLRWAVGTVMVVATVGLARPGVAATSATWTKQSPLPSGQFLHAVDMASASEAWAVGAHGTIVHSATGGSTWNRQATPVTTDLWAVGMGDVTHGAAVGDAVVLYTTDGGATWLKGSGLLGSYYGIDFVDALNGWAVGGSGGVGRTTDGGKTWSVSSTPLTSLKDVVFMDGSNGWAVGGSGGIIHTSNGGSTWTRQTSGTAAFLDGVSFVSVQEGWAAGEDVMLHTTNGGATWVKQPVPSTMWTYSLAFADALNGWSVGANQSILRTSDGGLTWTTQMGGTYGAKNRFPLEGVDFADPSHAIAVGACGTIFVTSNGTKWGPRLSGSCTTTYALEATDANHLWASNSEGEILLTTNGGRTWSRVGLPVALLGGTAYLGDVEFIDNLKGWTVSSAGTIGDQFIYRSTNGGKTWTQTGPHDAANLFAIDTMDGQTIVSVGYACCVGPRIVRSADGGTTWSILPNPPGVSGDQFYDIEFNTSTTAWIVGDTQDLLKSTDGGLTWIQQGAFGTDTYFDISWADSLNGWIAALDDSSQLSYMLHTTDGGATWVRQSLPTGAGGNVFAVSPTEAWVGGSAAVAHTTDGGTTWTTETPWANSTFNAVIAVGGKVWTGGFDVTEFTGGIWKRP